MSQLNPVLDQMQFRSWVNVVDTAAHFLPLISQSHVSLVIEPPIDLGPISAIISFQASMNRARRSRTFSVFPFNAYSRVVLGSNLIRLVMELQARRQVT